MTEKRYPAAPLLRHRGKSRRTVDERGHVTTDHWDGRKDVTIRATGDNVLVRKSLSLSEMKQQRHEKEG